MAILVSGQEPCCAVMVPPLDQAVGAPPIADALPLEAVAVPPDGAAAAPDVREQELLPDWSRRVREQREALAQSDKERATLRTTVERLQRQVAKLQAEQARLRDGGADADLVARRGALRSQLEDLERARSECGPRIDEAERERTEASAAEAEAEAEAASAEVAVAAARAELGRLQAAAEASEEAAAEAEARLGSMVAAVRLRDQEAKVRTAREELATSQAEARQLRVALAEAISSGADLPNTLKELELLKESATASTRRIDALEAINAQLQGRLVQLHGETKRLKTGAVDLRSEGDLMREVLVEQSQQLLRRVEDLTDESYTAVADKKQLLASAADLLAQVDEAETRMARCPGIEEQCNQMATAQQTLRAEVERLCLSNDAFCEQVFGEDGEGPFAGLLMRGSMLELGGIPVDEAPHLEVGRLVRGEPLLTVRGSGGGASGLQADAAGLALKLQQILAEREEAFWIERSRLSDRVASLERVRGGGRTGALLVQYDAAARGGVHAGRPGASPPCGGTAGAGAYATAGLDSATAAVSGGWKRLQRAAQNAMP